MSLGTKQHPFKQKGKREYSPFPQKHLHTQSTIVWFFKFPEMKTKLIRNYFIYYFGRKKKNMGREGELFLNYWGILQAVFRQRTEWISRIVPSSKPLPLRDLSLFVKVDGKSKRNRGHNKNKANRRNDNTN